MPGMGEGEPPSKQKRDGPSADSLLLCTANILRPWVDHFPSTDRAYRYPYTKAERPDLSPSFTSVAKIGLMEKIETALFLME